LSRIDQSLTGLTHLVTSILKATGYPITLETSYTLQNAESICGHKRDATTMDSHYGNTSRARVSRETSYDDTNFSYYGQCTVADDSEDADSISDDTKQGSDDKSSVEQIHSEADFDKFLAYIADEDQTPL
jgi:hypothetical protein